jgi:hypothetical protein
LKLRHSRINHEKRKTQYLGFAKRRKKSRRQSKKICKLLLKYLSRLMGQLDDLLKKHAEVLGGGQFNRLTTITKLKEQQWQLHFGKQATVPDRINKEIPLKTLFDSYKKYCTETGHKYCARNVFSNRLKNIGYSSTRKNKGVFIHAEKQVFK